MTKPTQIYPPSEIEDLYVLRRKSDGKYYRGARYWKWTKRWRGAAILSKGFWNTFVIPLIKDDVELLDIREVISGINNEDYIRELIACNISWGP